VVSGTNRIGRVATQRRPPNLPVLQLRAGFNAIDAVRTLMAKLPANGFRANAACSTVSI